MYGDGDKNYDRRLMDARLSGECHNYHYVDARGLGGTHFDGWRTAKDNAVCALFVQGQASVAQAVAANVKPKELITALDNTTSDEKFFALAQEMIACGIDVLHLQSTKRRMMTRLGHEFRNGEMDKTTLAETQAHYEANKLSKAMAAKPRGIAVKKADGKETVLRPKDKPLTTKEVAVAVAMAEHEQRELMRKKITRLKAEKARLGVEVTPELEAQIAERMAGKDRIILK